MNGIVTVLGDKRVIIRTHDASGAEMSYMLVEGQSRGGIKLLSVDTKNGVAKFDNHGALQVVRICSTPELTVAAAALKNQVSAPSPAHPAAAVDRAPAPAPTAASSAAGAEEFNPGYLPVAASGRNSPAASGGGTTDTTPGTGTAGTAATETTTVGMTTAGTGTANDSSAGTSTASDPLAWAKNTWWYTGSQDIEQARTETADAVRNGALPAYPLTPLTPAATPADLIGPGQAFFNHFAPVYRVMN
jgi:hypothetical protein